MSSLLYDVIHVSGEHPPKQYRLEKVEAVKAARLWARDVNHRYAVVEAGTFQAHAIVWPDGGVDYLKPPQEL